ncbi:MAG: ATP-binding protein [Bryobacteraceae bacterium]
MPKRHIEGKRARRLLATGFLLIILLLVADGIVGFYGMKSIRTAAAEMAEDQLLQMALIDEIQREQGSLSAVFYRLAGDPESVDRDRLLLQIGQSEGNLRKIASDAPIDAAERPVWNRLVASSVAFADEARRLLSLDNPPTFQSRELLRTHDEVLATVAQLIRLSHGKARRAKANIEALSSGQLRKDGILLGLSLILAVACAAVVLRLSSKMYGRLSEQSEELNRISWQLLDSQETVARRLSHELHDELGQTLTALKTNFAIHGSAPCASPAWIEDCSQLLKDSIRSAHEMSQLLRPTILDDFGLDSALSWLCERCSDRTGIDVRCSVDLGCRLSQEIETHLFRIAQEALTNITRHSGASGASVELHAAGDRVCLSIRDNGKGLPPPDQVRKGALGLTGMRARARTCRGELKVDSRPGQGVSIEVWVPLEMRRDEEKDPHLVG